MAGQPTQPGWGPPVPPQRPPSNWGAPPPPKPPSGKPPWWRRTWVVATATFFPGAMLGTAGAGEQRTVTVTSISLVTVTSEAPTTTVQATTTAAPTTQPRPTTTRPVPATTRRRVTTTTARRSRNCDPSYPTVCIPPPPPDLNCPDIPYRNFVVRPPDPHGFDGNDDGVGCES
jgi:hypothetical protein